MLRLHRHILSDLFWNFAFTVVVICGIFVIAMTLDFIQRSNLLSLALLIKVIPSILIQALGMAVIQVAVLVSVISTFGRIAADGEMTILKSSGIHPFQTLPPALFLGIACACITLYVNNELVPRADRMRKLLLNETNLISMIQALSSQGKRSFSLQDCDLVWQTEEFPADGGARLNEVMLREKGVDGKLLAAASAELHVNPGQSVNVRLRDWKMLKGSSGDLSTEDTTFEFRLAEGASPMHLQHRTGTELVSLARRIARQGHPWIETAEVMAELHGRLATAMACVVFVILGVPIAVIFRASNRSIAFALAFGIVLFFYYPTILIGRSLAARQLLDPGLSMWSGDLLLSALGITLLAFVVRR